MLLSNELLRTIDTLDISDVFISKRAALTYASMHHSSHSMFMMMTQFNGNPDQIADEARRQLSQSLKAQGDGWRVDLVGYCHGASVWAFVNIKSLIPVMSRIPRCSIKKEGEAVNVSVVRSYRRYTYVFSISCDTYWKFGTYMRQYARFYSRVLREFMTQLLTTNSMNVIVHNVERLKYVDDSVKRITGKQFISMRYNVLVIFEFTDQVEITIRHFNASHTDLILDLTITCKSKLYEYEACVHGMIHLLQN